LELKVYHLSKKEYQELLKSFHFRLKELGDNSYHYSELRSKFHLVLAQLCQRYDPEKRVKFTTYANYRIAGLVSDYFNSIKTKALVFLPLDEVYLEIIPDKGVSPEKSLWLKQLREVLMISLSGLLGARIAIIFKLYYFEGRTMKEIARFLRVTESYISRVIGFRDRIEKKKILKNRLKEER
jgi:RNA polymerase sigma factor (sigma-70 family)